MILRVGCLATFLLSLPMAVLLIALWAGTVIPVGTLNPAEKARHPAQPMTITEINHAGTVTVNNFA